MQSAPPELFTRIVREKEFELKDHLGNVRVVVSDVKLNGDPDNGSSGSGTPGSGRAPYVADLRSYNNYYAFGMLHADRHYSTEGYRYGFNGMESDDEIAGTKNIYTAEFWQYDSRIGRRWNTDPVVVPYESPYAAFRNNPIAYNDPNGDCSDCPEKTHTIKEGDTYWDLAENSGGEYTADDLKEWNSGVDPKKLQIGQTINTADPNNSQTGGNGPSAPESTNEYTIANPDLKDFNIGQYPASRRPAVAGNVPFTTYITPTIDGNRVRISGRVTYSNTMGGRVSFSSVAYLHGRANALKSLNASKFRLLENSRDFEAPSQIWPKSAIRFSLLSF